MVWSRFPAILVVWSLAASSTAAIALSSEFFVLVHHCRDFWPRLIGSLPRTLVQCDVLAAGVRLTCPSSPLSPSFGHRGRQIFCWRRATRRRST
jgi:hypothetical protein